jgi:ketosteroid isomerase-like protein
VSAEQVELIRRGYEAWNAGDRDFVLEQFSPDVEWVTPRDDPDPAVYRGVEGVVAYWDQWRAAVGQLSFSPSEFIDAGDAVVVVAERRGRGESSGLEVADVVFQVFHFGDGLCRRVEEFYDRDEALTAAGAAGSVKSDSATRNSPQAK